MATIREQLAGQTMQFNIVVDTKKKLRLTRFDFYFIDPKSKELLVSTTYDVYQEDKRLQYFNYLDKAIDFYEKI